MPVRSASPNPQTRRRSIDERLKRLADLFEPGDHTKTEYVARKNELLIERNQLERNRQPYRSHCSVSAWSPWFDDWSAMTDEKRSACYR